ncbi:glutathione transferase GstA [Thauera sp. Sel9]|uniref:glutathione transferase GstA n=1 Tax=Thauera sp. Sel9 TaxID=2974299 RepID=UPI0021E12572|nr:glutathione transferase GstA [Thauera sp. Sel9]MCV2216464.1 glutathione transferase GstA [Thauera sp. Sel9]
MKLYYKPGACSLSPHIVLEELGLPYETEAVDLQTKVTAGGADFTRINPKGYVPALVLDGGEMLTEGPAIVQYLADLAPEKKLAPANGSLARYQLQSWLTFIGTELHKSCSPFFNPASGDAWRAAAQANLERRLGYVDKELAGKAYLMGEDFSVADAYLFTVLGWMGFIQFDLSRFANLTAFQARVAARPAVQAALKAEGLA